MIGAVLSLAALVPAALAARATSAALGLIGRGTPDPSEVDQLAEECDRLRAERDAARAELANAHRACGHALTVEAAATAEVVMGRGAAQAEAENLRCECDAARAEVERLTRERDEALQWRGVAASVEREAAEDRARLEEAIRERDAAQRDLATAQSAITINRESAIRAGLLADTRAAEVERLTRERDEARPDVSYIKELRQEAAQVPGLRLERDAAQAAVRDLSYKLDNAGHEWFEAEKEREATRADLATMRRLVREVLDLSGNYLSEKNGTADQARNALRAALPPEADGG